MDPAAIIALVGVIITLPLSIIALVQARKANSIAGRESAAAERAVQASEEQTEIQRALSRRGADHACGSTSVPMTTRQRH